MSWRTAIRTMLHRCRGQPALGLIERGKLVTRRRPSRWRWIVRRLHELTERLRQHGQQRQLREMFCQNDDDRYA